jgi:hypothetical protein
MTVNSMNPLPSWVDPEAFSAWVEMRRKKKVPWSDRCFRRALKRLQEIKDAGHCPNKALECSEYHGWTDIYPDTSTPIARASNAQSNQPLLEMEAARKAATTPEAIAAREACKRALKVVR